MKRYNPSEIEKKWLEKWDQDQTFKTNLKGAKQPFYNLMMFPYPSGDGLHVGHVYAFGGADTYGHYQRMKGSDVFEPMGFDSFGIHTENYAIKVGRHPKEVTEETTKYFRDKQLKRLGGLFAWDHELVTSDPSYYKWTQWLFIQLFKAGLAVRKKAKVEWCPSCKTVLANEQVIAGRCERCNSVVEQKDLEQWFFKITDYTEKLLKNLEKIDWSETTKTMQRNWIGKSDGAEIDFAIKDSAEKLKVFTTRPDTIFGATFMAIAPEHSLAVKITTADNLQAVNTYIQKAKNLSPEERTKEKSGVFTGSYATNPLTKKEIPIWIADYVLTGYGTGAIMAVPAHDQRDYEFAKKYGILTQEVISSIEGVKDKAFVGEGKLVNSEDFNDLSSKEAKTKISEYIEEHHFGQRTTNYHLRDWLISRQRYWGPPIPMIHCENCAKQDKSWFTTEEAEKRVRSAESGVKNNNETTQNSKLKTLNSQMKGWYPESEKNLPVALPEVADFKPLGTGKSPLATVESFYKVSCPGCGSVATRETDVSDTFLDSSWYFLRYPSTEFKDKPFDIELTKKWLPVDMYIGGNEHAVLHLLYTRFITMVLNDLGWIDFDEPFKKFRALGLIIKDGAKMSKSRGNVINPNEYMDAYGADTLRMYLLFIGPFDQGGEFSDRAIIGVYKYLNRVWNLVNEKVEKGFSESTAQVQIIQQLKTRIANDIENLKFNTAVAALMEGLNKINKEVDKVSKEDLKEYVQLLAPFAPFTAEELWQVLGAKGSIHHSLWPSAKDGITDSKVTNNIVIQVNGHLRDKIDAPSNIDKESITRLALDREKIKVYTAGNEVKNIIWVEGKLLNLVI